MFPNFLAAGLKVAFNHYAFYDALNFRGNFPVVHDFLDNADLLFILLVGVGMVGVNNGGRVHKIHLPVHPY